MYDEIYSLIRDTLERHSIMPRGEGEVEIDGTFELSSLDVVARWLIATTLEDHFSRTLPDQRICQARTLNDLINAFSQEQ